MNVGRSPESPACRQPERAVTRVATPDEPLARAQPQRRVRPRKQSANPILTAVIAFVCGVAGAAGYSLLLRSQAGRAARSPRPNQDRTRNQARTQLKPPRPSTLDPGSSFVPNAADDLKQQIMSLSKRIDRLGERVDRLQELLSLAVPLLQRIAPKQ